NDRGTLIRFPDWPPGLVDAPNDYTIFTKLLKRANGEVLLTAPLVPDRSRVWRLRPGSDRLETIGDFPLITVLAETPSPAREVLAGTWEGQVLTLKENSFHLRWDVARLVKAQVPPEHPVEPLTGIAALGPAELLVRDGAAVLFCLNKD